jgi:transposase
MREDSLEGYTAFVGLDWSHRKHDVCVQPAGSDKRSFGIVEHNPASLAEWITDLHGQFGGTIAVALELARGPVVSVLQRFGFVAIFPINPSTLARYREAFQPSRAKDDPTDAELILDLVIRHRHRFQPLRAQSAEIRSLATLVEHRRQLVNDRVRVTNRLRASLKEYYPQILDWFDHIDTSLFCAFFRRWPTLKQAKCARANTMKCFFRDHHMYREHVMDRRLEAIKDADPLTDDEAIIEPFRMNAQMLVGQLEVILESIQGFDQKIEEVAQRHPDYELFKSFPGAGPSLAPRLLVAFGEQRERFTSAADVQMYAGIAPVTERSGKKHWVHWRWQCPTFLRQTFVEWAGQSINKSYWAGQYYHRQRAKGLSYQAACRGLAFKWIRIAYRCWQTGALYDESQYLKALEGRGSSLVIQPAKVA